MKWSSPLPRLTCIFCQHDEGPIWGLLSQYLQPGFHDLLFGLYLGHYTISIYVTRPEPRWKGYGPLCLFWGMIILCSLLIIALGLMQGGAT